MEDLKADDDFEGREAVPAVAAVGDDGDAASVVSAPELFYMNIKKIHFIKKDNSKFNCNHLLLRI